MTSNPIVTLFYHRLLSLDANEDAASLIEEALKLAVQVTSANAGYVEVFAEQPESHFCKAYGFSEEELAALRRVTSSGMIAHAITEGRTFATSPSARAGQCTGVSPGSAIVCAPIGRDAALGLVYLQGNRSGRSFTRVDAEHAELFARRLESVAPALVPPRKLEKQISDYKRRVIREVLRRNGWNTTRTARALGIGRAALYRAQRK